MNNPLLGKLKEELLTNVIGETVEVVSYIANVNALYIGFENQNALVIYLTPNANGDSEIEIVETVKQ